MFATARTMVAGLVLALLVGMPGTAGMAGAVDAAAAAGSLQPVVVPAEAAPTPVVSSDARALAQTLVKAKSAGNFSTDPPVIFDREIAPLAQGSALPGCGVDVRVLQIIVLAVQRFGSARVTDIQRPCIGSNLNCGAPNFSVHCLDPGEAVDFGNVGGVGMNGSNSQNLQLLQYLDNFVPKGTNAGQQHCRAAAGTPLALRNFSQFADTCNHQHIDFRNTDAPLDPQALLLVLPTVAQSGAYVKALYNDYLDRSPTAGDVSFWGNQLANGAPRSSVAAGFVNSDEYRLIRIDSAYTTILKRPAEPGGRLNWLQAMQRGAITTDDIETALYASEEYYQLTGGTDVLYASALYQALLGRAGTDADYAFWAALVVQNGRQWVIGVFWDLPETISSRVSAMYQLYLGRVPDAGGLQGWVNVALAIGDSGLRAGLTSSDEYFNRAQKRYPPASA